MFKSDIPAGLNSDAIIDRLNAGNVRFILPTQIGKVTISDRVSSELMREVLEAIF